jgi:hypothetical protein
MAMSPSRQDGKYPGRVGILSLSKSASKRTDSILGPERLKYLGGLIPPDIYMGLLDNRDAGETR